MRSCRFELHVWALCFLRTECCWRTVETRVCAPPCVSLLNNSPVGHPDTKASNVGPSRSMITPIKFGSTSTSESGHKTSHYVTVVTLIILTRIATLPQGNEWSPACFVSVTVPLWIPIKRLSNGGSCKMIGPTLLHRHEVQVIRVSDSLYYACFVIACPPCLQTWW